MDNAQTNELESCELQSQLLLRLRACCSELAAALSAALDENRQLEEHSMRLLGFHILRVTELMQHQERLERRVVELEKALEIALQKTPQPPQSALPATATQTTQTGTFSDWWLLASDDKREKWQRLNRIRKAELADGAPSCGPTS
tara:strand:+ start:1129 stop:1563 length:435 start_codon:yes stop_codon:yes gene_type:complete